MGEFVMLSVAPETRGRVKERKGEMSYNDYLLHLLDVEDEHRASE
jgi:hypothetical protein